jgi:hypothetical protein
MSKKEGKRVRFFLFGNVHNETMRSVSPRIESLWKCPLFSSPLIRLYVVVIPRLAPSPVARAVPEKEAKKKTRKLSGEVSCRPPLVMSALTSSDMMRSS